MSATILHFIPMAKLDCPPNRIREQRLAAGHTQETLATAMGVKQNFISRLERGTLEPSVARMRQIARVLGVDIGQLLSRDDNAFGLPAEGRLLLDQLEKRPELAAPLAHMAETMQSFTPQPAAAANDVVPIVSRRRR